MHFSIFSLKLMFGEEIFYGRSLRFLNPVIILSIIEFLILVFQPFSERTKHLLQYHIRAYWAFILTWETRIIIHDDEFSTRLFRNKGNLGHMKWLRSRHWVLVSVTIPIVWIHIPLIWHRELIEVSLIAIANLVVVLLPWLGLIVLIDVWLNQLSLASSNQLFIRLIWVLRILVHK